MPREQELRLRDVAAVCPAPEQAAPEFSPDEAGGETCGACSRRAQRGFGRRSLDAVDVPVVRAVGAQHDLEGCDAGIAERTGRRRGGGGGADAATATRTQALLTASLGRTRGRRSTAVLAAPAATRCASNDSHSGW